MPALATSSSDPGPGPLGRPRLHLREIASTNDRGRALALAGAPHGTLVTAGAQTAGRGRQGRTWTAPAGRALFMSVVLRDPPALLPILAAVAVADPLGERAQIKWPNDLLVDGRKVAGILAEGRPGERWAVLGVGVNVALREEDLPPGAGTLGLARSDVEVVLAAVLDRLAVRLAERPQATVAAWAQRDALLDAEVAWSAGRGRACGIDARGRLLVRTPDGREVALDAGEVHLVASREPRRG